MAISYNGAENEWCIDGTHIKKQCLPMDLHILQRDQKRPPIDVGYDEHGGTWGPSSGSGAASNGTHPPG